MARETKWCQNPKCPEKKNSNQIRGIRNIINLIKQMDMVMVTEPVMIVGLWIFR